ncbi:MAG: hypothetical protein AAF493_07915 [Pseudomonadota bacterium]
MTGRRGNDTKAEGVRLTNQGLAESIDVVDQGVGSYEPKKSTRQSTRSSGDEWRRDSPMRHRYGLTRREMLAMAAYGAATSGAAMVPTTAEAVLPWILRLLIGGAVRRGAARAAVSAGSRRSVAGGAARSGRSNLAKRVATEVALGTGIYYATMPSIAAAELQTGRLAFDMSVEPDLLVRQGQVVDLVIVGRSDSSRRRLAGLTFEVVDMDTGKSSILGDTRHPAVLHADFLQRFPILPARRGRFFVRASADVKAVKIASSPPFEVV